MDITIEQKIENFKKKFINFEELPKEEEKKNKIFLSTSEKMFIEMDKKIDGLVFVEPFQNALEVYQILNNHGPNVENFLNFLSAVAIYFLEIKNKDFYSIFGKKNIVDYLLGEILSNENDKKYADNCAYCLFWLIEGINQIGEKKLSKIFCGRIIEEEDEFERISELYGEESNFLEDVLETIQEVQEK